jgi:flavin-dependent dehydrogenase
MGGGPAGSTVAALVAQAGFKTLLVEREKMPRFHIGESLMPETYWTFERLGVLEKMKRSGHPKKYSVQFVSHTGRESAPFYFFEHDDRECSQTWQVKRSEFDQMLYENAAEKGAHCQDQTRVLDVLLDEGRAVGARLQQADGTTRDVAARVVVDATGQQTLIAQRLGLVETNPKLRKAAIWGYYKNAKRDDGYDAGATLVLHTRQKNSWFWYIPLSDVVSVGVVGDSDYLLKGRGSPSEVFEEELVNCPAVVSRLMDAELVSKFRVAKEFSYSTRRSAGDGWVLVGDAFGFIDPIYSSGVFFALRSADLASDCIIEALRNNDTSAAQLGRWAPQFLAGVNWVRRLVEAFYTREFSFGEFMRQFPHHRGNLVDLLIGRIFHPGAGDIFKDLDAWLAESKAKGVMVE